MALGWVKRKQLAYDVSLDNRRTSGSFPVIAKLTLSTYFGEILYAEDFTKLRNRFIASDLNYTGDPVPTEELEFYKFICSTILDLTDDPQMVRSRLFEEITSDLNGVNNEIKKIELAIKNLEIKKDKNDEDILDERLYVNFLKKLSEARNEIHNFVSEKQLIHNAILLRTRKKDAYDNLSAFFSRGKIFPETYLYRSDKQRFTFRKPKALDNKPFNIILKEYYKLREDFEINSQLVRSKVLECIADVNPLEECQALIESSIVLANRKKQLLECLQIYKAGFYTSFVTTAIIQAEGIFEDICTQIAPKSNVTERSGFVAKIETVINKSSLIDSYIEIDYYYFYLPYLRNKIAHAKKLFIDDELAAGLLLLDLYELLRISSSEEIPLNKKARLLGQLSKSIPFDATDYSLLLDLQLYENVDVSNFSELKDKEIECESHLLKTGFWDCVDFLLAGDFDLVSYGMQKILKKMKKKGGLSDLCKSRLTKIKIKNERFTEMFYKESDFEEIVIDYPNELKRKEEERELLAAYEKEEMVKTQVS